MENLEENEWKLQNKIMENLEEKIVKLRKITKKGKRKPFYIITTKS